MAVRKTKHEMPEQLPKERVKNFKEVPYEYPTGMIKKQQLKRQNDAFNAKTNHVSKDAL